MSRVVGEVAVGRHRLAAGRVSNFARLDPRRRLGEFAPRLVGGPPAARLRPHAPVQSYKPNRASCSPRREIAMATSADTGAAAPRTSEIDD